MDAQTLRKSCGLTQKEFADLFEMPVRTLQQWEQGKSTPPAYVYSMMQKLLPNLLLSSDMKKRKAAQIARKKSESKHTWNVCIDKAFLNCEKIYPIQQRKVAELLSELSANEAVTKVVIFGSSTKESCHIGSDVDIYVQTTHGKRRPPLKGTYDFKIDLWDDTSVDDRLKTEIEETGVVVYERTNLA